MIAWEQQHAHGWCRECKAHRATATANIRSAVIFCPDCETPLENVTLHEAHEAVGAPEVVW